MYVVKLQGGLGNQMFQYAFLLLLKKRFPQAEVLADLSNYTLYNPHMGYQLKDVFGINVPSISEKRLENMIGMYVGKRHNLIPAALDRQINKLICHIINKNKVPKHMIQQQYTTGYPAFDMQLLENQEAYLNGTWMSEDYSDLLETFRTIYSLDALSCEESESMKAKILQDNRSILTVSVHIRAGDYIGTELQIIDETYYRRAFKRVCEEGVSARFYLFADDIELVQKYADILKEFGIPGEQIVSINHSPNKKDVDDLFLMSYCKYNIIANSTFSYWSALLNVNAGNKMFYPSLYAKEKEFWNVDWIPFSKVKIQL